MPQSGNNGETILTVTCAENTGEARSTGLLLRTDSGKIAPLLISQNAADRYVVNIRPSVTLAPITTTEDLSAFAINTYHIDNATQAISAVDAEVLESALVNSPPSNVLINWSPYGETNYCDYRFYNKDQTSPGSCWNPEPGGTVFGRWTLNTIVSGGIPCFNIKNAAFHQGSPIVEIVFSTKGWLIYTLHAFQNDTHGNYRRVDIDRAAASGNAVTVFSGVIYGDMQGFSWSKTAITDAGRWQSALNPAPRTEAITRVVLNVSSLVTQNSNRFRVLKWYPDGSRLVVFISVGTMSQGGRFNPTAPFAVSQLSTTVWDGTSTAPSSSTGASMIRPEPFYNPS